LAGAPQVIDAALYGRAIHAVVTDVAQARTAIPTYLQSRGIHVASMEEIAPSLEDVFVSRIRAAGGAEA
jgi:ABC-2 type transport system ATP-binding protein